MWSRIGAKVGAVGARIGDAVNRCRARFGWVDHFGRAVERYQQVNASRMAAALAYTTFLAVFPLLLVGYSLLGVVMHHNQEVTDRVTEYLDRNIPTMNAAAIASTSLPAGILGVIGLLVTGVNWVSVVRSVVRGVWLRDDPPANPGMALVAKGIDALVLCGVFILLGVSAIATFYVGQVLDEVLVSGTWWGNSLGYVLGFAINCVLYVVLLVGIPRLPTPPNHLWVPVIIGAAGLEIIKLCAGFLLTASRNPAYTVVATTVGMLVFFNLTNRLMLWCAALTATSDPVPAEYELAAGGS